MAKITQEQSEKIKEFYFKYRELGYTKTEARRQVAKELEIGRTTVFDHTTEELVGVESAEVTVSYPSTFILTGWDIRIQPDKKFIACLEQIAKEYKAELLLVPCNKSDARYMPEFLKSKFKVITDNVTFNENLDFRYVETSALVQSPLSGHKGAYSNTTILPGLVKELQSENTQYSVKQLMTVGSVGTLNATTDDYKEFDDSDFTKKWRTVASRRNSRPTAIAQNYIVPSALIIDVLDSRTFLTRYISSHKSGVVYDLNRKFTQTGSESSTPLALYCGDFHSYEVDPTAYRATKEMINYFNPKEVVVGDFFSGVSINHHEISSAIKVFKQPTLKDELKVTKKVLDELTELSNQVTYLESNHDVFLEKWLDMPSSKWLLNKNYDLACELQHFRTQSDEPVVTKLLGLNEYSNLRFVKSRDNYYVGKTLLKHGHEGISGIRAGFIALAKTYNNYIQGHLHSVSVYRNAVCVGTLSRLDLDYAAVGNNAWLHSNALIQPDSSLQNLSIIRGKWKK